MNILDVTIIAGMIFLLIRGISRGFIREVGSLAGVIFGIWLANLYQPQMTGFLKTYLPAGRLLPLISFALVFVAVLISCNLISWWLKGLFRKVFLGWADRGLGAALAILKGIILTYVAIVLFAFFVPSKSPVITESRLAPVIITSYQSIVGLIAPEFYRNLKRKFTGPNKMVDKPSSAKAEGPAGKDDVR